MATEYREATFRDYEDRYDGIYQRRDRVCMVGTDLFGTVRTLGITVDPREVLVDWDYYTPEEGAASWISTDYIVIAEVPS